MPEPAREYKYVQVFQRRNGMKRLVGVVCALLLLHALTLSQASPRFDVKLTPEKQISHVLSRLTFGARPGDAAEVRKVGVERWIDLQLNPERISESPALQAKVEPLTTLKLQTWEIFEKYSPQRNVVQARPRLVRASVLSSLLSSELMNGGSVDDRRGVLMSLSAQVP